MTNQLMKSNRRRQQMLRGTCGILAATMAWTTAGNIALAVPLPAHQTSPQSLQLVGLRQGATGAEVKAVQQALITAGVNVRGGADGQFGPATRQALVDFQAVKGLSRSGEVDEATAVALGLATPTPAPATGGVDVFNGLQRGAQGDAVLELQQKLLKIGVWVPGGADGSYGSGTTTAVDNFQRWNGLTQSGVVDAATAARLGLTGTPTVATPVPATPPAAAPDPVPATPSASTDNAYVGLAVGAKGDLVKNLQAALMAAGVNVPGGADGIFGNGTKSALAGYQKVNGLGVSGAVYLATASKLGLGAQAPTTPPAVAPAPVETNKYVGLAVGAQGSLVKTLQSALIAAGITVYGGADGAFGNATKTALAAYQQANGLGSGGSVDAATATKLGLGAAAPAPEPATPATPTPAATNNGYVGLTVGSSGANVKEVQEALMALGLVIRGGADGNFGAGTKTAVQALQQVNGLSKTGVVGEREATILGLGTPATADGYPKKGQSNEAVRVLQQLLIDWQIDVRGGADGSFGNATAAALTKFQQVHGLTVTGTVTKETATKMGLPAAGTTPSPAVGAIKLDRFPIQGQCFFGNTWHAPRGNGRVHLGVDIIADEGNLLYAVVDGTITKQYWDVPGALSGNGLRVAEDNGTYFTYLHMLSFAPGIKIGTKVKAGDVIGFVGNTGSSATAHLHFEIHPGGGNAVNPYPYIKAMDDCNNTTLQYQSSFAE